jgi:hypothetical protein
VDNLKLFITSYELSVFRNSEFSIEKINNRPSCWSSCLVAGSTVSKLDNGLDVGPLCFYLFDVGIGTCDELISRPGECYRMCLIACYLETSRIRFSLGPN